MTVKELICELSKYPDNLQVAVICTYDCGFGTAGGSEIEVGLDADGDEVYLYNNEC